MTVVQPGSLHSRDKELRSIGVWSSISHAHDAGSGMLKSEVLVFEFVSINGLSSSTVVVGEVTTLAHEVWDDAMECGALVAVTLLAGTQSAEVLACLWDDISAKLKQLKENFRNQNNFRSLKVISLVVR